jgi:uncharacterized protein involved in response to NO
LKTSLFAYGFRPLFLAAGLAAALLVPLWIASLTWGLPLSPRWPAALWHGHEMLFGFVGAAIGGFLLTAVPSWTGQRGFGGAPLLAVTALWLAGRLAPFAPHGISVWGVALIDLAYLPVVAAMIAPPLFRTRNRNRVLLLVLGALTFCNATFHCYAARGDAASATQWLALAIDLIVVLTAIIGGRIVPAFTNSGLRATGPGVRPSLPWLEALAIGATVAMLPVDWTWPHSMAAAAVAAVAGIAHLARALRWAPLRTRAVPLLWILHVGYAWIPVGLLLKAVAFASGAGFATFWQHALTVGALATLILAVMTRASLGHTGRELRVGRPMIAAYLLLVAAGLVRVFGAAVGIDYTTVLGAAAPLWLAAFATFVAVYAPILASPRVDGRPG